MLNFWFINLYLVHQSAFLSVLFLYKQTCAIDIFACGLLAYYVLTYGKHPYDCCSKKLNKFQIDKNTQSTTVCSSVSSSSSFTTTGVGGGDSSSDTVNEVKSFRCTTLSRQHERQLAIAEGRLPNLDTLTDNPTNVHESKELLFLSMF